MAEGAERACDFVQVRRSSYEDEATLPRRQRCRISAMTWLVRFVVGDAVLVNDGDAAGRGRANIPA